MKILLIGSYGQLGKSIAKSRPNGIELISLSRKEFNLLDQENCKLIINELKPNWIINCAAYTNVDQAEKEYELAFKINALAPVFLSQCIEKIKGKLLHISTDYVFDGKQAKPYDPFDKTNPVNKYGLSKAKGESNLLQYNNNIIIRTSWLYSSFGNSFLSTMLKLHNAKGKVNESLSVIYDQISAPTSTNSLSRLCWKIIVQDYQISSENQILHWRDSGVTSWYDFAIAIGRIANRKKILEYYAKVRPIKSKDYILPAQRPLYSLLDIEKTEKRFNIISNHWIYELEKTLEELC